MVSEPVPTPEQANAIDRRSVLWRCCAVGVVGVVAGCSSDNDQSVGNQQETGGASDQGSGQPGGGAQGQALAKTSQIPVGGGMVIAARKIVVTQPTAGDFRAFSAVCPHRGCLVSQVSGGRITCPCHGSVFSASDGSVQQGPANLPLDKVNIRVEGDSIALA
ncbi:iron-sulfur protein [Carbonactinospora thermoautotrophica]|uniref:Rieske (2Fe-2S) protein n=1 Tax=Carbonactinospora thermoautotrophica TaxID=1469144 RepID=UPI00227061B1|nr:Rieske (2Fe-2S) protein [Carbonactinospora thermoautotrophica]MCX9191123.1 iron-sulfur protein [Carbonactinospora thermoautotrophica]